MVSYTVISLLLQLLLLISLKFYNFHLLEQFEARSHLCPSNSIQNAFSYY